jgi:hypothetical protein
MSVNDSFSLRQTVYALLVVIAVATVAGHIAAALRVYEPDLARDESNPADRRSKWPATRPAPMPTFSSNDRSRWATVRALVDEGTFVIGHRDRNRVDSGIVFESGWETLDKVLDPKTGDYYSTKPPLLTLLAAGFYWLLKSTLGWTLTGNPFAVVRTILVVVNLVPFVVYLMLLARLADRYAGTDWGRLYVFAVGCFGTLVSPFLVTLNNHTVAACCVLFALYPVSAVLRLPWQGTLARRAGEEVGPPTPRAGALDREAAPLARSASENHPSLALQARVRDPSWLAFALSGFFASFVVCNELPALAFLAALLLLLLIQRPKQTLLAFLPAACVPIVVLLVVNYVSMGDIVPAYSKFGSEWYEYEGSHWQKPPPGQVKHGIDWAWMHESRGTYAFHVLVGHHGLLSLSPIWALALVGMVCGLIGLLPGRLSLSERTPPASWQALAVMTCALTVVVIVFYLFGTERATNNYGGNTSGLRWLMWLWPLWLLTMLPVADWMSERCWSRWVGYALLAWSIFSVNYPPWNPWRQPWLYNLLESGGYVAY